MNVAKKVTVIVVVFMSVGQVLLLVVVIVLVVDCINCYSDAAKPSSCMSVPVWASRAR